MSPVDIPAPDDPRVHVVIPVPLAGGRVLTLRLKRFDWIEEPVLVEVEAAQEKIRADETLNGRQRSRASILALLKPFVSEQDYTECERLPVGSLMAVNDFWSEQSGLPLGEFLASVASSTENTEAPSDTICSPADGPEQTSEPG